MIGGSNSYCGFVMLIYCPISSVIDMVTVGAIASIGPQAALLGWWP